MNQMTKPTTPVTTSQVHALHRLPPVSFSPEVTSTTDPVLGDQRPTITWRVVFDADAFYVQIANDLKRGPLKWVYAPSEGSPVEVDIPEGYLSALSSLGHPPGLISRSVRELRSVPKKFVSLEAARLYAVNTLGMSSSLEWVPEHPSFWARLFGRAR